MAACLERNAERRLERADVLRSESPCGPRIGRTDLVIHCIEDRGDHGHRFVLKGSKETLTSIGEVTFEEQTTTARTKCRVLVEARFVSLCLVFVAKDCLRDERVVRQLPKENGTTRVARYRGQL